MYRPGDRTQHSFLDFNQPMGLHMNPDNRWVKMADSIPWDEFETKYAGLFPSGTGNVAKPLRMALGALDESVLSRKDDRKGPPSSGSSTEGGSPEKEPGNKGTLTLPRRYRRQARKEYLAFAKCRKHTAKKVRAAIRKQLGYVHQDIGYLEGFMAEGFVPDRKDIPRFLTILKLYGQQKYMYDHKVHSVPERIVSISQPWLRPIVRGKATAPVEFGAKFDLSLDTEGYGRIEKISFAPYNEGATLQEAVERFRERTGHYPERVLADQIYRMRDNRKYCKYNKKRN